MPPGQRPVQRPPDFQMPVFLTPDEVAAMLKVSKRTVYDWLQCGQLRGIKAGKVWRVALEEVGQFIALSTAGELPPSSRPPAAADPGPGAARPPAATGPGRGAARPAGASNGSGKKQGRRR